MDASTTPVVSETGASQPGPATTGFNVPRYSYYALAILSLVNFLNYIDRQVLPAVAPLMLKDPQLGLTHAELGYIEASLLLSFTVLAPVFGLLGDRRSRTKLMASAAIIWSAATALTGFVDHLPFLPPALHLRIPVVQFTLAVSGPALALCFVRAIVGIGESSYSTITPSLIADYFPPQRRATALGVFQAAIPLGFALGFVIGGALAYFFGWRMAFMIVGVPGIITAILVWRLHEPVRGATDVPVPATVLDEIAGSRAETAQASSYESIEASRTQKIRHTVESIIRDVYRILTTRDWILSTAAYTALTFALGAFATWATVLLVEDKKMTATNAAITLGVVTLLGGAAGTFGGGWVADRLVAKRHNAYFLVCAVATLLGIVPTLLALAATNARVYLPAIFFAVMLLFISNAPFHAILVNSVPTLVRATAVALNIVIIHTCGDAISRAAIGVISDSLKAGHLAGLATFAGFFGIDTDHHLSAAMLVAPVALFVSTLFFFWGASKRNAGGSK